MKLCYRVSVRSWTNRPFASWGNKWGNMPHRSQPHSIWQKPLETAPHVAQPIHGLGLRNRRSQVRILSGAFGETRL